MRSKGVTTSWSPIFDPCQSDDDDRTDDDDNKNSSQKEQCVLWTRTNQRYIQCASLLPSLSLLRSTTRARFHETRGSTLCPPLSSERYRRMSFCGEAACARTVTTTTYLRFKLSTISSLVVPLLRHAIWLCVSLASNGEDCVGWRRQMIMASQPAICETM